MVMEESKGEDDVETQPVQDEGDADRHVAPAESEAPTAISRARRQSSVTKPAPPLRSKRTHRKKGGKAEQLIAAVLGSDATTPPPPPPTLPRAMTVAARALPLLVCSVGNPGAQYANTLHSAGHVVLNKLAAHLGYPTFSKDRSLGNGLVSRPSMPGGSGNWTLWQSTAYMNESGKGVRAAYMAWSKTLSIPVGEGEGRLVIVHDELEKPLGAVSLRTAQGLSAKGHNGLKSIQASIGNTPFVRIGIGIGRPVSRQSDDVANYVLAKMDERQGKAVEGCVEAVVAKLRLLEQGQG